MDLGNTINTLRKHKGLKQGDLATQSGLTQAYVSQIEKNKKEPNMSALKKICEVLGVPLPVLFFLSIDGEDVPVQKQDAYNMLLPSIRSFIEEFFIGTPLNTSVDPV